MAYGSPQLTTPDWYATKPKRIAPPKVKPKFIKPARPKPLVPVKPGVPVMRNLLKAGPVETASHRRNPPPFNPDAGEQGTIRDPDVDPPLPHGTGTPPPVAATAPAAAAPVVPPRDFESYIANDPDYQEAVADINRRRQTLIDMLGSSADSEDKLTTYGALKRQLNDDLYGSQHSAANAGFYSGGALQSLKTQNVEGYNRGKDTAVLQHNEALGGLTSEQGAAIGASRARWSQWLRDNPIPTADPPKDETAPPGSVDNPVTEEDKQNQVEWGQNANRLQNSLSPKLFGQPLVVVRTITAYLNKHGANIPKAQRASLNELRKMANKRYVEMTRGK